MGGQTEVRKGFINNSYVDFPLPVNCPFMYHTVCKLGKNKLLVT